MYCYRKISKTSVTRYFCIKRDKEIRIQNLRFSKVCSTPLHIYNRPTWVIVLANWKKSEEKFHFHGKTVKIAPSARSAPPNSLPRNYTRHQAAIVLNCLWVSLSKICPKVIASALYSNLAYKRFHRNRLLWENRRNLYLFLKWHKECTSGAWW